MRRLAPLLLLSGCASLANQGPSLQPRPIESRSNAESEVVPVPIEADPALDARIAERVKTVDAAAQAFAAAESRAGTLANRAAKAPAGSDAWLDAQTATSELGTARAVTEAAVADLEALAIAHAEGGAPAYPALDAALAKASAEAERENEVVTRLSALLDR
ncbi:hypothetical protein [Sphingomonas sp. DT-204]|uniref:hypothetical protein n=1 Tax=Sphingomonas sp. DT-204 TaxID=3396166 RepID=UPI003F1DFA4A